MSKCTRSEGNSDSYLVVSSDIQFLDRGRYGEGGNNKGATWDNERVRNYKNRRH